MSESEHKKESFEDLREHIQAGDKALLIEFLDTIGSGEVARAISRLEEEERHQLFQVLGPEAGANLVNELPEEQAADLIEELPQQAAAELVEELDSDDQADILGAMEDEDAEEILQRMDPEDALEARQLMSYDPQTAGGLMMTEFLSFPASWRIRDILADLEKNAEIYSHYQILYGYVIDKDGALLGILRFRDLLLSPKDTPVTQIMIGEAILVQVSTSLEDLEDIFDRHDFFAVPVVDESRVLIGIIRRADVREALESRAEKTFLLSSGILGGEEFRTMPLKERSTRRLAILSINIALNILSASVIAMYQDTLSQVIALAVFLPIISDLSGCSGNQAIAVSIRELSLGLLRPKDFARVFVKESWVGIINGLALGALLGLVAYIWKGNIWLGGVVGVSLFLNTMLSVVIGGCVPLLLKKMKLDPAIASSPLLTTITDVCGFFFVLSFASAVLSHLI